MKILIGSDVVPTEKSEELFIKQDLQTLFSDVWDKIKQADRTVINLECALTTAENGIKKFGPCLKADPRCADALKALGVTDVMLSNNHVFDFGKQGLKDTIANLDRVGLPYTGVGENDELSRKPHIVERDGKKLGFINVCEHEYSYALPDRMGANPYDPYLTMRDIRALKKEVDFVIVLYHGGKEHCGYPSPRLRLLCQEMVENGASVVVTQHSHCIGCYENYKGGHIVYGQGNFHFAQEHPFESWYTSLLIELTIDDGVEIEFYPLTLRGNTVAIAKGEDYERIMGEFNGRNEEIINGKWREGWHEFCEKNREGYTDMIRGQGVPDTTDRQAQRLTAALNCEAHNDVVRELYPSWNLTNEK